MSLLRTFITFLEDQMNNDMLLTLHPAFRPIAERILRDAQIALDADAPTNDLVRICVGVRTSDAQRAAFNAGLSQVKVGWHQYGLALDFAILDNLGMQYVTDGTDLRYRLVGEIAKRAGCVYGGDWQKPDWDHIEWHPEFTLGHYVAWMAAASLTRA